MHRALSVRIACLAFASVAACGGGASGGDAAIAAECTSDDDCILAGASCCACPSYAVPLADSSLGACDGVSCPYPDCSNNVQARCVGHTCKMECLALVCSNVCQYGFARADDGCLTCNCAGSGTCADDRDCYEEPADCCGCHDGGSDTAVGSDELAAHAESLECPPDPICPGTNVCDPEAHARCFGTRCYFVPGVDETFPGQTFLCGRAELGPCPATQGVTWTCAVNVLAAANAQGAGVCVQP